MRKTLSVVFALALLFPVGALAQTSTTSTATSSVSSTVDGHKAALQAKLAKVKDKVKAAAAERIDANIADLNKHTTEQYLKSLDQVNAVLTRVIARTDKVQADGKNVAVVRVKITAAQVAIAAAKAKIQTQALKTYSMSFTTEAGLKGAVQTVRKALHDDLVASQTALKAARQAVQAAITSLANVGGEATSTGVTSSTKQ